MQRHTVMALLVLSLRGAAAILVLTTLVGGIPRVVQVGLAATLGLWSAVMLAPTEAGQALVAASGVASGAASGAASGVVSGAPMWAIALGEVALGAALGVMSAVPLLAAAAAGQLVDLASASRATGPYSTFFGVLAAAVFVGIDGHVTVMTSLVESHQGMTALGGSLVGVLAVIAKLVPAAVKLAVPWLVTAAVVQISVGVGMRVGGRAAAHAPAAAAVPAALVMMTASLVATLAVAMAGLLRGAW